MADNEKNSDNQEFIEETILKPEDDSLDLRVAKDYGEIDVQESDDNFTKDITAQVQLNRSSSGEGFQVLNLEDLFSEQTGFDFSDVSIRSIQIPENSGELNDNGDGSFTFIPSENFTGEFLPVSFSFTDENDIVRREGAGRDSQEPGEPDSKSSKTEGDTLLQNDDEQSEILNESDPEFSFVSPSLQNLSENVEESNTAPEISGSIEFQVNEDNSLTITEEQLLQNASDIDGDNLSVENLTVNNGTLTDNGDGTYLFVPDENFNGVVDLNYDVSDGNEVIQATGSIDVAAVNDIPEVSGSVEFEVNEDNSITITDEQLLQNASDVDGDNLSVENLTVNNGTLTENGDGTYLFVPDENFNGVVDLNYDVSDGNEVVQATGTIDVAAVNDIPEVSGDVEFQVNEDNSLTITEEQLLQNATDIDGDNLSVENLTVNNGTLTDNGYGTYLFVPDENFNGVVDLNYDVSDGNEVVQATGSIDVAAVNDIPEVSGSVEFEVNEDNSLTITDEQLLENASDIDGDNLSVENLTVNNGTLTDNGDGTYLFVPDENFNGVVDLNYDVSDGNEVVQATGTIDVAAVNDIPEVSGSVEFEVNEDNSLTITEEQLLENATDIDGDNLSVENLTVNNGTLTDNGDGTYLFVPDENFNGVVDLNYDVSDGNEVVQATGTIDVAAVNDIPEVSGDVEFQVNEDNSLTITEEQLLQNATDIDGDNLSVENLTVNNGTLTDNGDGTYLFVPDENFNGVVDLNYDVSDGNEVVQATGSIDVAAVNDIPKVSGSVEFEVNEDNSITITEEQLLENASDIDGDDLSVENLTVNNGTLTDNGDGTYLFVPDENFNGVVDLNYDVSDGNEVVQATGSIDVAAVNDIPEVSGSVEFEVNEDNSITITDEQLLQNATDIDGDDLSVENLTVNNGTLTDNGDGTYLFVPDENFNGVVDLNYDVSDGNEVVQVTGTIDVEAVNDAPKVSGSVEFEVNEDNSITITDEQLLENASDIDGDNLSVENLTVNNGTLTDNGDGTYLFVPDENYNGVVDLNYDVSDGNEVVQTTGSIDVLAVNDIPEVEDDLNFTTENGEPLTVTEEQLLSEIFDVDGDTLSIVSIDIESGDATVLDNEDGTYTITPSPDYDGEIQLVYTTSDGEYTVDNQINVEQIASENEDEDNDRGHGNDPDGVDEDNPGRGRQERDNDNDRGHGNDPDGIDEDNPGQQNRDNVAERDRDDDDNDEIDRVRGRDEDDDHDRGHGNDPDGVDEDNPGQNRDNVVEIDRDGDDDDEIDRVRVRDKDDDHDRGHGNDLDGVDDDNPGKQNREGDNNRGHGNDPDGIDEDNPAFLKKVDMTESEEPGKISDLEILEFNESNDAGGRDWIAEMDSAENQNNGFGSNDWTQDLDSDEIETEADAKDELDMESNDVDVPVEKYDLDDDMPIV